MTHRRGTLENLNVLEAKLDDGFHMVNDKLDHMHNHQLEILKELRKMALDFTVLADEVARLETVHESAITLIHNLADEVAALKNDPVELQALVDRIKAADDLLATAVVENTPAAPPVE